MSIAVFYLRNSEPEGQTPAWQSQCQAFSDAQMGEALALWARDVRSRAYVEMREPP